MALSTEYRESSTRREERAPDFYQSYLNSPTWRTKRNAALRRASYQCERCGARRDFNVHHKTYANLGNEPDCDLEVLCVTCHNGHHKAEVGETTNPGAIYLALVSEVLRRHPFAQVADIADEAKRMCVARDIPQNVALLDRAISLACSTRLKDQGKPYVSAVDVPWREALTAAQTSELLARIRAKLGADTTPKPMPKARMTTQHELDRRKALQMIAGEMTASIQRCEELEAGDR